MLAASYQQRKASLAAATSKQAWRKRNGGENSACGENVSIVAAAWQLKT